MPDRGGPGGTPIYVYDDGPAGTTPIAPRATSGKPRRRPGWPGWPSWPGWRLRLKRPHPVRRTGDFLVFLAAADPQKIGSRPERYRYTSIGLLMLVTAAQAFYAATLFMSVSLGKPFRHELGFGAFFALAVFLIDRSIINFAAPIKLDKDGNLAPPKKTAWVLGIRVGIAIVAAILMSEMILLQVFKGDISEQIQNNHLAASNSANGQIEANYQAQIDLLQGQINSAQAVAGQRQTDVDQAYQAMNCQEFGCRGQGIVGGIGPGFAAAQAKFKAAESRLNAAQSQLQAVRSANLPQIKQLHSEEHQAILAAQPAITNADKVLSQEEAFWQLTVKNGTVLVVRLLLSLLILGIDLAPILTKLTGRTSHHDIVAHSEDYRAREKDKHETGTEVYRLAKQADVDRQVHDIDMQTVLIQARLKADVVRTKAQQEASVEQGGATAYGDAELYRIKLEASLRKHKYHHDYATRKAALLGEPWDGGNGGWPGGGRPGGGRPGGGNGGGVPPRQRTGRSPVDPYEDPEAVVALYHRTPVKEDVDDAPADQPEADQAPPRLDDLVPPPPVPPEDFGWSDPAGPAQSDDASLIDELAEILFNPEEPSGTLILDHRWILHDRLPGADVGSGGIVWRAKDRLGDARDWYVVKTVPSGLVDRNTAEYIQQLGVHHEQRASGMASDHIGQILDHGDDRGFSYLVYPLYEPGSLARYARWIGDQRTLGWCAQVIYEVLSGLMAASAGGLVHLDIKPGNIVLDQGAARVIDWGLSRVWNATHPSTWIERGTPFYACPEQLIMPERRWETPAADLYGVGATFYWLLAGEAPLQHEALGGYDLKEYRQLLLDGVRPQPVHELVPGVPRSLSALIDQWLSYDPSRRVPPGTLATDALRVARDQLSGLQPALPDVTVGRVKARRRRRPR